MYTTLFYPRYILHTHISNIFKPPARSITAPACPMLCLPGSPVERYHWTRCRSRFCASCGIATPQILARQWLPEKWKYLKICILTYSKIQGDMYVNVMFCSTSFFAGVSVVKKMSKGANMFGELIHFCNTWMSISVCTIYKGVNHHFCPRDHCD
jgi:hypothetical protein